MTKCTLLVIAISISVLLHSPEIVHCQVSNDEFPSHVNSTALLSFTQTMFTSLSDLTSTILDSVGNRASFCVKNRVVEWDRAFNFSSNLDFLKSCIKRTNAEDVIGRVCYAAELKDYFERFFSGSHYLKPHRNCNITSRVSGCEPGWACAVSVPEDVECGIKLVLPVCREYEDSLVTTT